MAEYKTVVCVEDEPEMIDLVKLVLERQGVKLIGAVGGQRGLEVVRRIKPDLVLLDMMMPDLDGWEFHRQMKADQELRDIPVIIVTALARGAAKRRGLDTGNVDGYVIKPFVMQELIRRVSRILGTEI